MAEKWKKTNFEIDAEGSKRTVFGVTNGIFGVHNEYADTDLLFVLSHLESGLKIHEWTSRTTAEGIGAYLADNYADDFARLTVADPRSPVAQTLVAKLKQDKFLMSEFKKYRPQEKTVNEQSE